VDCSQSQLSQNNAVQARWSWSHASAGSHHTFYRIPILLPAYATKYNTAWKCKSNAINTKKDYRFVNNKKSIRQFRKWQWTVSCNIGVHIFLFHLCIYFTFSFLSLHHSFIQPLSVFHYNFIYFHVYLLFLDVVPLRSTYNDVMHNISANITGKHIYNFYVTSSYGIA
jgi:hypothetical protein